MARSIYPLKSEEKNQNIIDSNHCYCRIHVLPATPRHREKNEEVKFQKKEREENT